MTLIRLSFVAMCCRSLRIRVEEKHKPRVDHPNDAIVRVTLAAICGSDLHLFHGMMPDTRVGHTFGHEFIGVVDEVGNAAVRPQTWQRTRKVELLLREFALKGSGSSRHPGYIGLDGDNVVRVSCYECERNITA